MYLSEKPPWLTAEKLINAQYSENKWWNEQWANTYVTNKDVVIKPSKNMGGVLLPRRKWTTINRIRIGQGRCMDLFYSNDAIRIMQHVTAETRNKL